MNIHMIILPALLGLATLALMFSLSLDPDQPTVVASTTPTPVVSETPASSDTPEPGATPSLVPDTVPSDDPEPEPSIDPSAEPSEDPDAEPSDEPIDESFGIAATTPDTVLREAQLHAGRLDPFKTVYPPNLPEFEPAIDPEDLALPDLGMMELPEDPPEVVITEPPPDNTFEPELPPPPTLLTKGLQLKGIIDGGIDPIALIEVDGKTELLRVGERLRGNIVITSIQYNDRRVTLSRGQQRGLLTIEKPVAPIY